MKTLLRVMVFALVIGFWQAIPTFATSMSLIQVNSMSVNCAGTTLDINIRLTGITTNADYNFGGTNYDLIEVVLYDGAGTAFAYKATLLTTGFSGTVNVAYNIFMNLPSYRPFTIKLYDLSTFPADFAEAQAGPLLDTLSFDPNTFVVTPCTDLPIYASAISSSSDEPQPAFRDGRLNNWDTGNPVVPFGHDYETGRGLVVYSPEGNVLLEVTPEQIAAVAECPSENTLIASTGTVALYRLTSCQYQLNAPSLDGTKTYVMIFNDLYENTGYSSHEE